MKPSPPDTRSLGVTAPLGDAVEGSTLVAGLESERFVGGGRYRLGAFLGRGASKQVFRGYDVKLGREIAVGLIARATGEAALVRLQREINAMGRLSDHPNIVTIYDVGVEDGLTYIVSEYVAGGSLAERLRQLPRRRMPVAAAVAIARQLCDALDYAHAAGIVHRDIKPGNVLLRDPGVAMLADFGMVIKAEDVRVTAEYVVVGTAAYMAPEQAGDHPVDARSDLYSLGAMLFELLCGSLPFRGSNPVSVLAQHATAPRPRVSMIDPTVPLALDELVRRLMAIEPHDRPQSAAEVRDMLDVMHPGVHPAAPARSAVAGVPLPPTLAAQGRVGFIGRAAALARLRATWRRARIGEPAAVLVRGNAGIGKTRLCAHFAQAVHADGATVLYGRCEEESLVPYGPFIEALRHFAAHRPELASQLDLPGGYELARLGWPVPGGSVPLMRGGSEASGAERAAERFQQFDAAVSLVRAMAEPAPLLVIFDDLHWVDVPTLRLLRHLVRFVTSATVMLVCTLRDDEPRGDERGESALLDIRREPVVEAIELDGLSEEETAELVVACGHEGATLGLVSRLRERTAGNPFYIEETLHTSGALEALAADGVLSGLVHHGVPSGVETLILHRLAGLSTETREVLQAAAIIGHEFGLGLLAAVVERTPQQVGGRLDEAIRDGIVIEVPGHVDRFAFRHALVRMTLYGNQTLGRRMQLHARCGEALEKRFAGSGPHAAELAHHFFLARHAGEDERALHYSLTAAQWASEALAYEDAAAHKDRALAILTEAVPPRDAERCDVLLSRGRALWRAGDSEQAQATFRSAAELARQLDDAERFASAALGFGRRYYNPGETHGELVGLLQEALRRLGERDSGSRARVLAGLAEALHFREPPERIQEISREAVAIARRLGDTEALVVALTSLHGALLHTRFLPQRLPIGAELMELIKDRGPSEHEATALHWRVYDLFELGDFRAARREYARLSELAQRLGQPLYLHFATAWEAKWAELAGRFKEAEELAARSLEFAERAHMPYAESNYSGQLFALRRDQGLLDTLPQETRRYIGEQPELPVWRAGMVLARLDGERREQARAEFDALAADGFAAIPPDLFWLGAMCLLAEACARLGDRERSAELHRILEPYAERNAQIGLAVSVGVVHRFLGMLDRVLRRWSAAEEHFLAAIEWASEMEATASLAHTRCDFAEMLLGRDRAGDREAAATHLKGAARVARQLGIRPLTQRVATLQDALTAGEAR